MVEILRFQVTPENHQEVLKAVTEIAQFYYASEETQKRIRSLDALNLTAFLYNFSGKRPLEELLTK